MGTYYHELEPNKTNQRPRNYCFIDTEAKIETDLKGIQTHTLKIGVANFVYKGKKDRKGKDIVWEFRTIDGFWSKLLSLTEKDRVLCVLAHNTGYDIRILDGFSSLYQYGYSITSLWVAQSAFIMKAKKGKQKILFLDTTNYMQGTLEKWGEMLGYKKVEVDWTTATDEELLVRCREDVRILRGIWESWETFCDENDLGSFAPTAPGQTFNAFRHRFMGTPIYIHANEEATEIERGSYYGGRVECFWLGKVPGETFYKLDINSMYPYVMRENPVPIMFKGVLRDVKQTTLEKIIDRYALIAECYIDTKDPFYPKRVDGKLCWPTGVFKTNLATPELRLALESGDLVGVGRVCVYESEIIFRSFVDHFYALRSRYKSDGNRIFEQLTKLMLNSLYGKFGQRGETWKRNDTIHFPQDGWVQDYDIDSGKVIRGYQICEHFWEILPAGESCHSFVAIASHVTAYARMHLLRLMRLAGLENVFYVDTDSLIVNRLGFTRLREWQDSKRLGSLKLEDTVKTLEVIAPKAYSTEHEEKRKGIPKSARTVSPGSFEYMQWQGIKGALHAGHLDRVIVKPAVRTYTGRYLKGQTSSSGSVSPLRVWESNMS